MWTQNQLAATGNGRSGTKLVIMESSDEESFMSALRNDDDDEEEEEEEELSLSTSLSQQPPSETRGDLSYPMESDEATFPIEWDHEEMYEILRTKDLDMEAGTGTDDENETSLDDETALSAQQVPRETGSLASTMSEMSGEVDYDDVLANDRTSVKVPWPKMYSKLKTFVEENGHANVPSNRDGDYYKLSTWIASQKKRYRVMKEPSLRPILRKSPMTENELKLLVDIGVYEYLRRVKVPWPEMYSKLKAFIEENGHANVPSDPEGDDYKLYGWMRKQTMRYRLMKDPTMKNPDRRSPLTEEEWKMLVEIGWDPDPSR